jgi:hypothetical protein
VTIFFQDLGGPTGVPGDHRGIAFLLPDIMRADANTDAIMMAIVFLVFCIDVSSRQISAAKMFRRSTVTYKRPTYSDTAPGACQSS